MKVYTTSTGLKLHFDEIVQKMMTDITRSPSPHFWKASINGVTLSYCGKSTYRHRGLVEKYVVKKYCEDILNYLSCKTGTPLSKGERSVLAHELMNDLLEQNILTYEQI